MTYMTYDGYLEKTTRNGNKGPKKRGSIRSWWLVKAGKSGGAIYLGNVYFSPGFIGKKIRFKVEVVNYKNVKNKKHGKYIIMD